MNHEFVEYLNTLHNEQAGNSNAIAEAQQGNVFYKRIEVARPEVKYLADRILKGKSPCVIILTGHAGDGKTTLLFQLLQSLNPDIEKLGVKPSGVISTGDGKNVHYFKDYSELKKEERVVELKRAFERVQTDYTILVANTGPLIEAFKDSFKENEDAESIIIDRMDSVNDYEKEIYGYPMLVLNIARINNDDFIIPYVEKIVADENWNKCAGCKRESVCPILRNIKSVRKNRQSYEFIRDFYIWEQEHGRRATIRQISAHIAFALTGGLSCQRIIRRAENAFKYKYQFSDLLFGGNDAKQLRTSLQIKGVKMLHDAELDCKGTGLDYALYVQKNYEQLFPNSEEQIICRYIDTISEEYMTVTQKRKSLKRLLIVYGGCSPTKQEDLYADVFSKYYPEFLKYKRGEAKPNKKVKDCIRDALSVIFTGYNMREQPSEVYLTLRRNGEKLQNVQMLIGKINLDEDEFRILREGKKNLATAKQEYELKIYYEGKKDEVEHTISLPLLNYFEKTARGLIITEIDPMLTHGIESLKAKLLSVCEPVVRNKNGIALLVRRDDNWKKVSFSLEDEGIER